VFGMISDISGDKVITPMVALLFANIVLVVQIFGARRLWRSLMGMD
jgi:hypothetical protein